MNRFYSDTISVVIFALMGNRTEAEKNREFIFSYMHSPATIPKIHQKNSYFPQHSNNSIVYENMAKYLFQVSVIYIEILFGGNK